jgi:predicted CopG family antitoxin
VPREWKALWVKRDLYEYLMKLKREGGYRSIDELLRTLLDYFPLPERR